MAIAGQVLVLLHLIGFAALLGGVLVQSRVPQPEVNGAMLQGAWIELVTGGALVAWLVLAHQDLHYAELAVKFALTLLVVLLVAKNRKFQSIPRGLWVIIGALTLTNTALSVLWR
jgi:hypothetical protein